MCFCACYHMSETCKCVHTVYYILVSGWDTSIPQRNRKCWAWAEACLQPSYSQHAAWEVGHEKYDLGISQGTFVGFLTMQIIVNWGLFGVRRLSSRFPYPKTWVMFTSYQEPHRLRIWALATVRTSVSNCFLQLLDSANAGGGGGVLMVVLVLRFCDYARVLHMRSALSFDCCLRTVEHWWVGVLGLGAGLPCQSHLQCLLGIYPKP